MGKPKLVMKIPAQFMVVGVNGVSGKSVRFLAEGLIRQEIAYVTTQLLNSVVMIVRWMALVLQKLKDVTRIRVQSMEDLVPGMNGLHALSNVAVETKQEQDDATIRLLNLVDWNARVTLQNANGAIWTLVHHLVLPSHCRIS